MALLEGNALIGTDDIFIVAGKLLHVFEVPLHGSGLASPEDIKNSFTLYRMSDACADLWNETVKILQVQASGARLLIIR
jgi:hypothetical protein